MSSHRDREIRFIPSAVDGISNVVEVAIFPDRLQLQSGKTSTIVRFIDIARWWRHGWFYRTLTRLGCRVRGWPSVADRDWFHPPSERFFRFYTMPAITVYLADEPRSMAYSETLFRRVQDVLAEGGFGTFDLG